jgi:HD-like signal output (HDOD) protein/CheY-like chemotaxis protein
VGKRILFVDDENSILKALERLFFDFDYELYTAESGDEGLRILADTPMDIIVSDMRMPGMDGHQFLRKVKALYPGTTRLILSGYADEEQILDSLIDGSNSMYLFKPWNGEELQKKIAQLFEARQIYRNQTLLDLVNRLENISLVTGIYDSVCRRIEQDAEISAIAKVIETDPAVTASVLRVVNSAFYNIKTGSVTQAITFLGLAVVKSIVLSCSLFKSANIKVPPFSIARLTRHASTTNLYMTRIYTSLLNKKLPDDLTSAGLLHNLGLLMFLHYFPDTYLKIIRTYCDQPGAKALIPLEKAEFGVSHSELGGYLLDWWGIPYATVECSLLYHEPLHSAVMDKEAVGAVHIANYYAWKCVAPSLASGLDAEVFSALNIAQRDCEKLLRD